MFGRRRSTEPKAMKQDTDSITELVRRSLDVAELKYTYSNATNHFSIVFMGDDLPINVNLVVDDLTIRFVSHLDLKAKPEKYKDVAWELNGINKRLRFGAFYLDPDDGMISFEYSFPYVEANPSTDFILAFMKMFVGTVDEYDGDLKNLAESVSASRNAMYG